MKRWVVLSWCAMAAAASAQGAGGLYVAGDNFDFTQAVERALAQQMSQAWMNFARSGNPKHKGLPNWPAYSAKKRETMIFDLASKVSDDPHPEERKLWEALLRNG